MARLSIAAWRLDHDLGVVPVDFRLEAQQDLNSSGVSCIRSFVMLALGDCLSWIVNLGPMLQK